MVCPYRQNYYLFEPDKDEYQEFDFEQVFTQVKLPDLEIDFDQLLQEAKESE